jgi:hypothetical protein
MDIDTTSINELPIANVPHQTGESAMQQNNTTSSTHIMIDPQSTQIPEYAKTEKRVQFADDANLPLTESESKFESKTQTMDVSIDVKIVILSSIVFFLFMDPKVKKYLLNILVQIFGNFLKTEHGNLTQIGILVYSMFFGLILLAIVKTIDIGSFHLAL